MAVSSVITVSQLNFYIKSLLDESPALREIYITGEISNLTDHYRSGHIYLSLKDDKALVRAVMFAGNARHLRFKPEEGMKVIARGRVSVYEATGQYQLYIEDMQPDGIGALNLAYEQLKKKLSAEGLFSEDIKKPIPAYPKRIGVITSPTGAAVQDILNILGRRYPIAEVVFCPVLVQGENASAQLIDAIERFNKANAADVIIIGRGGGSIEDLWAFNDEKLDFAKENIPKTLLRYSRPSESDDQFRVIELVPTASALKFSTISIHPILVSVLEDSEDSSAEDSSAEDSGLLKAGLEDSTLSTLEETGGLLVADATASLAEDSSFEVPPEQPYIAEHTTVAESNIPRILLVIDLLKKFIFISPLRM